MSKRTYKRNHKKVTAISKAALSDFYAIRALFTSILHNEMMDVNNPSRADKRTVMVNGGVELCNKWINSNDYLAD